MPILLAIVVLDPPGTAGSETLRLPPRSETNPPLPPTASAILEEEPPLDAAGQREYPTEVLERAARSYRKQKTRSKKGSTHPPPEGSNTFGRVNDCPPPEGSNTFGRVNATSRSLE
mgnify:CR=1 FL=1